MAGFANEARFHMSVDQETLAAAVPDGRPGSDREDNRGAFENHGKADVQQPRAQVLRKSLAFGEIKALADDASSGDAEVPQRLRDAVHHRRRPADEVVRGRHRG